ncbi:hypothetical protein EV356DRAFT_344904 [Viridothelium virens]|uniref:Uncharacterized protein n=1 Tax=Viridothelium virens TaxID=1048519 RepID=A0A6A6GXG5_VIRVR|nr:hypothetical protein EV356DRAFT_344904 [Viridothelium virens]
MPPLTIAHNIELGMEKPKFQPNLAGKAIPRKYSNTVLQYLTAIGGPPQLVINTMSFKLYCYDLVGPCQRRLNIGQHGHDSKTELTLYSLPVEEPPDRGKVSQRVPDEALAADLPLSNLGDTVNSFLFALSKAPTAACMRYQHRATSNTYFPLFWTRGSPYYD